MIHLMQCADFDWGSSIFEAAVFGGRATRPVDRGRDVGDHAGSGAVGGHSNSAGTNRSANLSVQPGLIETAR